MSVEELGVEERLARDGVYATKTRGFSMRPLFKTHRDAVIITPPTRPLRRLDMVLYTYNGEDYILHRIVGFDGDMIIEVYKDDFSKDEELTESINYLKNLKSNIF